MQDEVLKLFKMCDKAAQARRNGGTGFVVVTSPDLRRLLERYIERRHPGLGLQVRVIPQGPPAGLLQLPEPA